VPADGGDAKAAALALQRRPADQGQGHFAPGFGHQTLKCRAGDTHLRGGHGLMPPFQVRQTERLQLFVQKRDPVQLLQRQPDGLKNGRLRLVAQTPPLTRAGHLF
jgi:hypothetical protein